MTTNNKISNLISTQLPSFVRDDHENFVNFLEAYYEWMEQTGNTVDIAKNIKNYYDVDQSIGQFIEHLYKTFIPLIPNEVIADKNIILKHVKDFYRARGTEKATIFLLRILFGSEADETSFYYPKRDILRASDGKWFIEKSLKFNDAKIDGVANTNIQAIKKAFEKSKITGNTSTATAIVERMDSYYEAATFVNELKLSNQSKDFSSGETIFALFDDENGNTHTISANIFSGIISKVNILNPGTGYSVGSYVPIESNTGNGGLIQITSVTSGNIKSVYVFEGGAGFQTNNIILFTGTTGTGANAIVSEVEDNSFYHPNTYNIVSSTIELEANTPINNTVYSNLNSSNINSTIANAVSFFTYGNTGPIKFVTVINTGNNYSIPTLSVSANTRIRELGILGKMKIVDGGLNYVSGDKIEFINISGGYGIGASGNVTNVSANGKITEVKFEEVPGFIVGGSGYDQNYLPIANVLSGTGNGANIIVTAILGYGESLQSVSDSLGAIQELTIISGGSGYKTAPTLNLTSIGDGTALANTIIVTGAYNYSGYYLNDDGHLSGYNFLENRDYYQNFSYVIRLNKSIEKYRKYVKDLLHPSGLKLFGEYLQLDEDGIQTTFQLTNTDSYIIVSGTYISEANTNGSTITITTNRDMSCTTLSLIEFKSGNAINSIANLTNGIFYVTPSGTNNVVFTQANNKVNGSGNVYVSI